MIQNAAARLVFSDPKRAHVTPLFISLHWLLVAARFKFKTLMLAYRTATGSAPTYFLISIYIPSRSLRSTSEHRLMGSQKGTKSLSRTFSFTAPGWWNELPYPDPECWIPDNFQVTPENSSLPSSLDFIFKKNIYIKLKIPSLSFLNFALFPLTSHCLARICFEQCLEISITSTSCVRLPLYNVSLIVFLNCKLLWIKASAKWINVNVKCKCVPNKVAGEYIYDGMRVERIEFPFKLFPVFPCVCVCMHVCVWLVTPLGILSNYTIYTHWRCELGWTC